MEVLHAKIVHLGELMKGGDISKDVFTKKVRGFLEKQVDELRGRIELLSELFVDDDITQEAYSRRLRELLGTIAKEEQLVRVPKRKEEKVKVEPEEDDGLDGGVVVSTKQALSTNSAFGDFGGKITTKGKKKIQMVEKKNTKSILDQDAKSVPSLAPRLSDSDRKREVGELKLEKAQVSKSGLMESYLVDMQGLGESNPQDDLADVASLLEDKLTELTESGDAFKVHLDYKYLMVQVFDANKRLEEKRSIYTREVYAMMKEPVVITKGSDMHGEVGKMIKELVKDVLGADAGPSGWRFHQSLSLYLKVAKYTPIKGGSYIRSPDWIELKKCCVNVQNDDDECFKWAIVSALTNVGKNAGRVCKYRSASDNYNWSGIDFPTPVTHCVKFEKNNDVSVNLFRIGEKEGDVQVLRITDREKERHVDLGMYVVEKDGKVLSHYVWIKNFSRFMTTNDQSHKKYYCKRCLHGFMKESTLERHRVDCSAHAEVKIQMPEMGKNIISFEKACIDYQVQSPFSCYADFECLISKDGSHVPCGYAIQLVSHDGKLDQMRQYTGQDCMERFYQDIEALKKVAMRECKKNEEMEISEAQEMEFRATTNCYLCDKILVTKEDNEGRGPLRGKKVTGKHRDHNHLTGEYRGAACARCNLNFNLKRWKLPVFFHNLRGYDSHIIMQAAEHVKESADIKCIPNNMEKYMEFEIGKVKYLDSLQFMPSSLSVLVGNLARQGLDGFVRTRRKWVRDDLVQLVIRKGVYPYEYMDSFERFDEICLPPKDTFYSQLSKEGISDEDYEHAQKVWDAFDCKTMKDYHNIYLITDTLQLTDVFENFRKVCYDAYRLDPCNFITSPQLAWNAMLKRTGVKLETLTDLDMHLMIEKGVRGGMCMVSKRYSEANNKYVDGYDPEKPSKYITYLDANNLYGWAMCQPLPTGGYRWELGGERTKEGSQECLGGNRKKWWTADNVMGLDVDGEKGYILEVNLKYPTKLHYAHDDYPLAPESRNFEPSPFMSVLAEDVGAKLGVDSKLIPNLCDKTKYVLHLRNLQQYLRLGMELVRVHRVISFNQSRWLKKYIDFNTEKRKQAKNDFEKDFWKLMNNAVFGKFMENVRNRVDVQLVRNEARMVQLIAKPTLKRWRQFNDNLAGFQMRKTVVTLNKPIPIGFSILDISKTLMYDFHYGFMKQEYGDRVKLLYTDTDSFLYEIQTEDFYQDMTMHKNRYDLSEYPKDHPLYDPTNAKVIGKMKDEVKGQIITEFVGLKPKLHGGRLSAFSGPSGPDAQAER